MPMNRHQRRRKAHADRKLMRSVNRFLLSLRQAPVNLDGITIVDIIRPRPTLNPATV